MVYLGDMYIFPTNSKLYSGEDLHPTILDETLGTVGDATGVIETWGVVIDFSSNRFFTLSKSPAFSYSSINIYNTNLTYKSINFIKKHLPF